MVQNSPKIDQKVPEWTKKAKSGKKRLKQAFFKSDRIGRNFGSVISQI